MKISTRKLRSIFSFLLESSSTVDGDDDPLERSADNVIRSLEKIGFRARRPWSGTSYVLIGLFGQAELAGEIQSGRSWEIDSALVGHAFDEAGWTEVKNSGEQDDNDAKFVYFKGNFACKVIFSKWNAHHGDNQVAVLKFRRR